MEKDVFGQNLRVCRICRGMSQKEVSRAAGMSLSHISHLETGRIRPSVDTLLTLCTVFKITPNDLLKGCY